MNSLRIIFIILISFIISKPTYAKNPSDLIKEIVDQASMVLSSDDPVESKIIKLNDIAERSVDINGIGMYTLGKYRKTISEEDKSKYQKLFKSYFLKSFSSRLIDFLYFPKVYIPIPLISTLLSAISFSLMILDSTGSSLDNTIEA